MDHEKGWKKPDCCEHVEPLTNLPATGPNICSLKVRAFDRFRSEDLHAMEASAHAHMKGPR